MSLQMQEGNLIKINTLETYYPYLSIDQLKYNQPKYSDLKGEVSDFFNIKFDQRYQHRDKTNHQQKLNNAKNNNPDVSTISTKPEMFPKLVETSSQGIKVGYQSNIKKKLDSQKMLQNLQKLITRQKSFDLKYHIVSKQKKKQKKKTECITQKKIQSQIDNVLSIENNEHKIVGLKSKTMPFQQMLKKCSKLKQIVRYENQLVNQKVLTNHGIAIKFYTEPFSSIQLKDDSFYQANKFKIRPSIKKSVLTKFANFFHNSSIQPLKDNQKTLDIRKYNNNSVMKQRSKFIAKRNMLKQQRYKEHREARRSEPVKSKKDEDMVTPWDQIDPKYDNQLH